MSHALVAHEVTQADIDQLYAKLEEKKWHDIPSVLHLRRHLKYYALFRRILSSQWLALLYLSVQDTSAEYILDGLKQVGEVERAGPRETILKYCRAGRGSWRVMSQRGPGVLATIELSDPISETSLDALLDRPELSINEPALRPHCKKVFGYLLRFMEEKQGPLMDLLEDAIDQINAEFRKVRVHPPVEAAPQEQPLIDDALLLVGGLIYEPPLMVDQSQLAGGSMNELMVDQSQLAGGSMNELMVDQSQLAGGSMNEPMVDASQLVGGSMNASQLVGGSMNEQLFLVDTPSPNLEMTFNKNTQLGHVIPYDSEIFEHIIFGDLVSTRMLLFNRQASIYDVDPFGLPILYYAAYYCARGCGVLEAFKMCNMLTLLGANMFHTDEVGNTPLDVLADCCIAAGPRNTALLALSSLFGKGSAEFTEDHAINHGFTDIHRVLLRIRPEDPQLGEYLQYLHPATLFELIDNPDFHGRSALVYAVEYGWSDAVETLLHFGANANQLRVGDRTGLTLLHLLFAGPAQKVTVRIAMLLVQYNADVHARDSEGWTPMLVAASWNNYLGMAALANAGADIMAETYTGDTVLTLSTDPQLMTKYRFVLDTTSL